MRNGNLTVLIADDEAPARARLASMVNSIGGWDVVAEAAHGQAALDACAEQKPDVVLLDIRMPGIDGIEAATRLCDFESPPAVIFTTAYDEYAVKAFETFAIGYLLKPVREQRLLRALEQAAHISRMKLAALAEAELAAGGRRRIPVTLGNSLELVSIEDVIAFRADQKYVQMIYEQDGRLHESLIDEPLKDLEQEFAQEFMRIHRNALVRTNHIKALERLDTGQHEVTLHGYATPLPVSRRHYAALKDRLQA